MTDAIGDIRDEGHVALARIAVVKCGFIIAEADGLHESEMTALISFAAQRAGMGEDEVRQIAATSKGGVSSLTLEEVEALKAIDSREFGLLLNEGVKAIASADGELSDLEVAALDEIWNLIALEGAESIFNEAGE